MFAKTKKERELETRVDVDEETVKVYSLDKNSPYHVFEIELGEDSYRERGQESFEEVRERVVKSVGEGCYV